MILGLNPIAPLTPFPGGPRPRRTGSRTTVEPIRNVPIWGQKYQTAGHS